MTNEQSEAMVRLGEVLFRLTETEYPDDGEALERDDTELRAALRGAAALAKKPAAWLQNLSSFSGLECAPELDPVDPGPAPREVTLLMPTRLMQRTLARMQRQGMQGGLEAGIKAAVVAWTPEPPPEPLADLVTRFMAAAKAAPAPERAAAVGRVLGAAKVRLDAMEAAGYAPERSLFCARVMLRKFQGSPAAKSYLREAMEWLESCALSDISHRGEPAAHPQIAGMREDLAWATPTARR